MTYIHPTADVQSTKIGLNSIVWQFSIILPHAVIGENCNINCHVFIENDVCIGNNVTIKPGVQIWDGVTVEDNVFIGPNVTFTNDIVPRSKAYPENFMRTLIKKGASIGANATIIAGNIIGAYSLIGAGSVVTKDIPDYHIYYGNPAKHTGYITKLGIILDKDLVDKNGVQYMWYNEEIILK